MKILKSSLKRIIREELSKVLSEQTFVGPSRKEIRGLSQSEADKMYGQYLRAGSPSNYDPTDLMNKALGIGSVSGDFVQDAVEYGDTNYPKTTTAIEALPGVGSVASLARLRASNTPEEAAKQTKNLYRDVTLDTIVPAAIPFLPGVEKAGRAVETAATRAGQWLAAKALGPATFDTIAQAAARKAIPKAVEKAGKSTIEKAVESPVEKGIEFALDSALPAKQDLPPLSSAPLVAKK